MASDRNSRSSVESEFYSLSDALQADIAEYEAMNQKISSFSSYGSKPPLLKSLQRSITETSRAVGEIKSDAGKLRGDLDESIKNLNQHYQDSAQLRFLDTLKKALKQSIKQYQIEYPDQPHAIRIEHTVVPHDDIVLLNESDATSFISYADMTNFADVDAQTKYLNQLFQKLYDPTRAGAHPFIEMLDKNLRFELTDSLQNSGKDVFKISGGRVSARTLTWNAAHQELFAQKILANNLSKRQAEIQPQIDAVCREGILQLASQKEKITEYQVKAIQHLETLTAAEKKQADRLKPTLQSTALHEASELLASAKASLEKIATIAKDEYNHENVIGAIRSEFGFENISDEINTRFTFSELASERLEQLHQQTEALSQLSKEARSTVKDIEEEIKAISQIDLTGSVDEVKRDIKQLLTTIQSYKTAVENLEDASLKQQSKLIKGMKEELLSATPEIIDLLEKTTEIIDDEKQYLMEKKGGLFARPGALKADQITQAIERAVTNISDILKITSSTTDKAILINAFLTTKINGQPSIDDALKLAPQVHKKVMAQVSAQISSPTYKG